MGQAHRSRSILCAPTRRHDALPKNGIQLFTVSFDDASWVYFIVTEGGLSLLEQITRDAGLPYEATNAGAQALGPFERRTFVVDLTDRFLEVRTPRAIRASRSSRPDRRRCRRS